MCCSWIHNFVFTDRRHVIELCCRVVNILSFTTGEDGDESKHVVKDEGKGTNSLLGGTDSTM